jgi:hypothetical protein
VVTLEARFHPERRGGALSVRVGWVHCRGAEARIEAAFDGVRPAGLDGDALLAKLRFLVDGCGDKPLDGLRALRSDFWSFVVVPSCDP